MQVSALYTVVLKLPKQVMGLFVSHFLLLGSSPASSLPSRCLLAKPVTVSPYPTNGALHLLLVSGSAEENTSLGYLAGPRMIAGVWYLKGEGGRVRGREGVEEDKREKAAEEGEQPVGSGTGKGMRSPKTVQKECGTLSSFIVAQGESFCAFDTPHFPPHTHTCQTVPLYHWKHQVSYIPAALKGNGLSGWHILLAFSTKPKIIN